MSTDLNERALPVAHGVAEWVPSPFLHLGADRIYNPLTDTTLFENQPGYAVLVSMLSGRPCAQPSQEDLESIARSGWLVREGADASRSYRLKYVSLETSTACNQACYFCPVSIAPREDAMMSDELFERIIENLGNFRDTMEGVFLQSYNEPTVDRRFIDHCRRLFAAKIPIGLLTNGSGLTPAKVDILVDEGPLRFLSVNMSTLDRERYREERGADHLEVVLRNLESMKTRRVATEMKIVVLGTGDARHKSDFAAIRERFAGSSFAVESYEVMDRAGYLEIGLRPVAPNQRLRGCENVGSRPLQHLHVTPQGKCVFCCEDYDEKYVVGDLTTQTIEEVLGGPELALLRKWSYDLETAPEDFICRRCIFARTKG